MLLDVWRDVLPACSITADNSFFELGGDSLLAVSVLLLVEKRTGRRLPLSTLYEHPTIRSLAEVLDATTGEVVRNTLIPIRTEGQGPNLFLINGSADTLVRHLVPRVRLFWLNHLQDRAHAAEESVESLARDHIQRIRRVQPTGPYRLAGFSFGGLVAYEMAQQLRAVGEEIALLAVIDTREPFRTDSEVPGGRSRYAGLQRITKFCRRLPRFLRGKSRDLLERVITLQRASRYERHGRQMPADLLEQRNFQLFKAAARRYVCRPYHGNVTYLTTDKASPDARHAKQIRIWKFVVRGTLEIRPVAGVRGHMDLMREPGVGSLVSILNEFLDGD